MNLPPGAAPPLYFHLEIESDDQIGCVKFHSDIWRQTAMKLLLETRAVAAEFDAPEVTFRNTREAFQFDWFPSSFVYFVSVELAEFMATRIRGEFLPIRDMDWPDRSGRAYKILHLFDRPDAVDRQQSEFTEFPPDLGVGIAQLSRLVLDHSKIKGSAAFVLKELAATFFRADLCGALLNAGFKGLRFRSEKDYRFGC